MQLSPAGLHLIASFEGYVPTPYNDAAGNATIGFGHLLHTGPVTDVDRQELGSWPLPKALGELDHDAGRAVAAVSAAVRVRLGIIPSRAQARFDALVSLAYNIGGGALADSSLIRHINEHGAPRDWLPCGPYWLEWCHAGGQVLPGLLTRRRHEFAIFAAGRYL